LIALRREQADWIRVELESAPMEGVA
jgi:hypothetical protein